MNNYLKPWDIFFLQAQNFVLAKTNFIWVRKCQQMDKYPSITLAVQPNRASFWTMIFLTFSFNSLYALTRPFCTGQDLLVSAHCHTTRCYRVLSINTFILDQIFLFWVWYSQQNHKWVLKSDRFWVKSIYSKKRTRSGLDNICTVYLHLYFAKRSTTINIT